MKKFIFLDIDGVLNTLQDSIIFDQKIKVFNAEGINKTCLHLVKFVCDHTGAKVVISSSWKVEGLAKITGIFEAHGWHPAPLIDITPNTPNGFRGDEIFKYLEKYGDEQVSYVIIDDSTDFHMVQPHVHVDPVLGFTGRDAIKAIDIIGCHENSKEMIEQLREEFFWRDNEAKNHA